jgi:hypothetical protein
MGFFISHETTNKKAAEWLFFIGSLTGNMLRAARSHAICVRSEMSKQVCSFRSLT